jgi:N-methylhydantoinase A
MTDRDCRLGVDVGGTFTDVVLSRGSEILATAKIPSTLADYAEAILDGALRTLASRDPGRVRDVVHATTVATNAILENRGAKTGLITTKGFRDILEIGRLRYPRLYDLAWERPPPLVRRALRLEVTERVDHLGDVITPLDAEECERAARRLADQGAESIAVCFLNSYANPAHERKCGEILEKHFPKERISLSADVLPQIREYDRTSTTVINAYVKPLVESYLSTLSKKLSDADIQSPVLVMQSHGGIVDSASASDLPAQVIESGPAAGVVAAAKLAKDLGLDRVISLDMGGTTAKAATVENFEPRLSAEYEVGSAMSWASRLNRGGGYLLRLPTVDLAEIGAGGGSLISVDAGGSLHVGPQSAGADPGPACYSRGGSKATLTDANVVLGFLNQKALVGGELSIDAERSRKAIEQQVAVPLGVSASEAARGAHLVANSTMSRAVRAVSTERGRDVRTYTLIAFGGSGPVHAAEMARSLGISEVVVPPYPGLFSSIGLLTTDLERHYSQSLIGIVQEIDPNRFRTAVRDLESRARHAFEATGHAWSSVDTKIELDMRYEGQSFELPVPAGGATSAALREAAEAFEGEHERTYGHRAHDTRVELVTLRFVGRVRSGSAGAFAASLESSEVSSARSAYFGRGDSYETVAVIPRSALIASPRPGPFIVEEYDSTIVVPPDWLATCDPSGNVRLAYTGGSA